MFGYEAVSAVLFLENQKSNELKKKKKCWIYPSLGVWCSTLLKIDIGLDNMEKHKKYTGIVAKDFKTKLKHGRAWIVEVRFTPLRVLSRLVCIYMDT